MSVQQNVSPIAGADMRNVTVQPPAPQSMWKELFRYHDNRLGVMLIVPSLLTLVLVQFYPIVYTGWLILTSEKGEFIGLGNLTRLTTDTIFHDALFFSVKMGIVVVPSLPFWWGWVWQCSCAATMPSARRSGYRS